MKIASFCGPKLIKVELEMGGKDPFLVCNDANIDKAVASLAEGAFINTGQSCDAVERIYVEDGVYDEFVSKFVKTVQTFTVGDPNDEKTVLGPLTREPQIPFLEHQVKDALSKGAKVLCGGKPTSINGKGYFF